MIDVEKATSISTAEAKDKHAVEFRASIGIHRTIYISDWEMLHDRDASRLAFRALKRELWESIYGELRKQLEKLQEAYADVRFQNHADDDKIRNEIARMSELLCPPL